MPAWADSKRQRSKEKTDCGEAKTENSMKAKIRKIATFVEETQREMEREISPPTTARGGGGRD